MDNRVAPEHAKVHLATFNGSEHPLRVFFEGRFDKWQCWQSRKNFERPYVVSLIQLPERGRWLYVGTYAAHGCEWKESEKEFFYELSPMPECAEMAGRLIVNYARTGRGSYLLAEGCADRIAVHEVRAERMHLEEFPGFKKVDLGFPDLEVVVRQSTTSWRTALSNVAGVYLISDPEAGKLYVGSANGEGGIWARWSQYVDGHGNNVEMRKVIEQLGVSRAKPFRFSILEIADVHASPQEVIERESHWKRVLLTRKHGYNAN